MHAIKAIYNESGFYPMQPIPVDEDYEVVITFINPIKKPQSNLNETSKRSCAELIGLLKGKVWMADDFNAPLDELKEYM
ncbi:MAG: DUF2281 domain-containing protein [Lachnospiraceae bacterium]|nr:DUF2281 domain-containing protein [Lachnospiraceae bacterium]